MTEAAVHTEDSIIPAAVFDVSTPQGWQWTATWLRGYRNQVGLTQREVAARMGTSQSQVSEFERGLTDPYVSTIARYMRAIGLVPGINAVDSETGALLIPRTQRRRRKTDA